MGLHDYQISGQASKDYGFYALIMAAMRVADTPNLMRLRNAFPEVWHELQERYESPGGRLGSEREKE